MSKSAIRVEGLWKQYRLGGKPKSYNTLRDSIAGMVTAPARLFGAGKEPRETFWALSDVNFDLKEGEVLGVIGRNGAGKSTLLKVLSRITEPTRGVIEIRGRVGSLLEVGSGFHPELSGRENIFLNGAILGMRRGEIERKLDEIVAFAEVEKFVDTPVKHYSSGMYLRLAFAVAAHLEPEILIVDEVLAVGDMSFQRKCLGKMQDVAGHGRTVLFVSHNMSAVTSLCSRAIMLQQGSVIADGLSGEVVAQYLSNGRESAARAAWDNLAEAPGQDGFKLMSMEVLDRRGELTSVSSVEEPLRVRARYRVSVPDLSFRCAMVFHREGTCAFTSVQRAEKRHLEPGVYETEVEIPGNLLAEGEYTVDLSVFGSRGKKAHFCKARDILAFQTFDPVTGGSARGDYTEGMDGAMRPLLDWETRYEGEANAAPRAALAEAASPGR
jgi:lipopolysaccharide transport system ATP-binding protein